LGEEARVAIKSETDFRLYRSISEVSELVDVKPHVLRYWETQFSMLRPRKNRAGNRMYRPEDVQMLLRIKELLYARRFTIEGARKRLLEERRTAAPPQVEIPLERAPSPPARGVEPMTRIVLHELKNDLRQLLARLK
jgi:DNA-binding transcriptional MerR regulator